MAAALDEARAAQAAGEVPVGAVIVRDGAVLARAGNRTVRDRIPPRTPRRSRSAPRPRRSGRGGSTGCTLYVTLEPCAMCAGAIVLARIDRVVFGAWDDKAGMAGSVADLLRHPG